MRLAEKFLIYEFNKDGKYSAPIDTDDLEFIFSEIYLAGKVEQHIGID